MSTPSPTRRRVLGLVGGLTCGIAGCASLPAPLADTPTPSARERCGDRRVPERHVGLIELEEATPPEGAAAIRSEDLPPGERALVNRAVDGGAYRICLPEASPERADAFASFAERVADHAEAAPEGGYVAYLEHNGTYYALTHVRKRDVVVVTSTG